MQGPERKGVVLKFWRKAVQLGQVPTVADKGLHIRGLHGVSCHLLHPSPTNTKSCLRHRCASCRSAWPGAHCTHQHDVKFNQEVSSLMDGALPKILPLLSAGILSDSSGMYAKVR